MSQPDLFQLEKALGVLFAEALQEKVFPGAVVGIACGPPQGRQLFTRAYGRLRYPVEHGLPASEPEEMREDVLFDLASLTKPLATVLALLSLLEKTPSSFSTPLSELLRHVPAPQREISLGHLLGHASGLPAHRPYFEVLRQLPPGTRQEKLLQLLLAEKLLGQPGRAVLYSDLGYMLLAFVVEALAGKPFERYVSKRLYAPLLLEEHLFFNPDNRPRPGLYAPTEQCPWRHKVLLGQVHDDNCYALGGVAGHAGLFGDINGVLRLALHLLDYARGRGDGFLPCRREDFFRTVRRQNAFVQTTWGLGFDSPSVKGSSGGGNLSPESFGHLGFTGTSFWIDPHKELVMVLLSNRVHPHRSNEKIRMFRPRFHDTVTEWWQG